ncbi:uncharacterized protein LOC103281115 isoform X2 [Anolis carolinensis]|uniref:uncharacterized protein LOC103281115 isoform X2 n=1 Tax=Anolis carolinensis TaxID=28377 RepID=UPI002F2B3983
MPLLKEETRRLLGIKMDKKRRPQSAHRVEEEDLTTAVEHSSEQVINPPRKKKKKRSRKRRRRLKKPCALRWQPASPQLQVRGRKCAVQAFIYKRLPLQGQVTKLKNCYRSWKAARTLPKAADLGQSHTSLVTTDGKKLPRKEKGEHSAKPSVSNLRENQRLQKNVPVEKKGYQTLSEYKFICPGNAIFQCTRQSVKQQLRSIYMGNTSQKVARSRHPSIRIPRSQWGINNPQRRNPTAEAKCPVGSDFPRNTNSRGIPLGVSSLTYRINKLLLTGPEGTAVNRYATHQRQQPAHEKATPEEECFEELSRSPRQGEDENWRLDPGYNLESRTATKARSQKPTRLRPVSAKESYRNAWHHLFGGEEDQGKEDPEKRDEEENTPKLSANSKAAIVQTRSAIVVPTIAPYTSEESLASEGPSCNAADPFHANTKEHGLFHTDFAQSKPGEMSTGSLSPERRMVNDFTVLRSRRFEALGMDAW